MKHPFTIISFNTSEKTGTRKTSVEQVTFVEGIGIQGDAHAGKIEDRQVSLLSMDEIEHSKAYEEAKSKGVLLEPGDFAENMTTRGVILHKLPLGTKVYIGEVILEVSRIGKSCHAGCEITKLIGQCIMPSKGIFMRVLKGGTTGYDDHCYYELG
ncbi:MAG: MOSC domain-containing protein [Brevinemataceae bacterium]